MEVMEEMENGKVDMDNDDWERIESLLKTTVEPINGRLDKLQCAEHHSSILTIETERKIEKEQKKNSKDSRDWILRIAVAVMGLLALLDKIGAFKSFAK